MPDMETCTIVKIGGKVLDDSTQLDVLLTDFVKLEGAKVLVHGGGKTATQMAKRLGIEAQMVQGRRITDAAMLEVAIMVYGGLMNKQIVAQLQAKGHRSIGLTGADLDMIRAHKRPVKEIDYGFVGDIDTVNTGELEALIGRGIIPVCAPLTHDGKGQLLNTNADTIAASVAGGLGGSKQVHLVYCFEKAGVLEDPEDDTAVIPRLDPASYEMKKVNGVIVAGMIPKLDNAFAALQKGAHRVYICKASALQNLGTPSFIGTEILL